MGRNGAPPPDEVPDVVRLNDQQTLDDRDQTLSDREQEVSDGDRATSDWGREDGVDSASRARTSAIHAGTARGRLAVRHVGDETAIQRDQAAQERDELAAQRDRDADIADKRALEELRARGIEGRKRAARDRELAARDREQAKRDRENAGTDELTGARRRGVGMEELEREIVRARRTGQSLVVAYVDVDGLKQVNDEHGHSAGDELLREVAEGLRHHMRSYDLLVRLGGDEFLCVLPGVTVDQARRRLDELGPELPAGPTVGSISIGLSELGDGEGAQELIERADRNLLAARSRSPE
jgi:diguanylate cyclase (GGDEF)-like protein